MDIDIAIKELSQRVSECERFIGDASGANVSEELGNIHTQVSNIYQSDFEIIYSKLSLLQEYIDGEYSQISQVLLTLEAKKTFVLEHYKEIMSSIELLNTISTLKDYVNHPQLESILSNYNKVQSLANTGLFIKATLDAIENQVKNMAIQYNRVMDILTKIILENSK